jgi:alkylhydroperoxidase family enzyme
MTWLTNLPDGGDQHAQALAVLPNVAQRYQQLSERIWQSSADAALLELCRIRIAALHCFHWDSALRSAAAAHVTEAQIAALPDYSSSPLFTEQQRRCLEFAEQYVMDVHGITDDDFHRVAETMTPAEMTAFTFALGIFDGMARFSAILGINAAIPALPDEHCSVS